MISKWQTISAKSKHDYTIFSSQIVTRKHPDKTTKSDFVVLNSPDWVNIIPLTSDGEVVFVRQYRHGKDDISLEIPGGLIDKGEQPYQAAERECIEETGYAGTGESILLAEIEPNPAFLNNTCYCFLWTNCQLKSKISFDAHEDIETVLIPIQQVPELIRSGMIQHSLVLNAFLHYWLSIGFIPEV